LSRRGRAAGFAAAAAVCAGIAASATGDAGDGAAAQLGALRDVVVAAEPLPARRPLRERVIRRALELRRVPERFVPPDALASPAEALGRSPAAPIAAGGYVLGSQLELAGEGREAGAVRLGRGRTPVEIAVEGAGALASRVGSRGRVDVVVTTETGPGGGSGRTYVAAEGVGLIELRPAGSSAPEEVIAGPAGDAWVATLALTRGQALRLIHAESFARSVRLIGH
jgi:Flp pilus assembly protein CpaB